MWVTIVAVNYLSYARVLAESLTRVTGRRLVVVITDGDEEDRTRHSAFDVWTPADIGMPRHWAFQFTRKELAAALKPLALACALEAGAPAAIFVDPDMLVSDALNVVEQAACENAIVLSPHLIAPVPGPQGRRVEREILRAGVFNGGLLAVSESSETRRFLAWWRERIDESCSHDLEQGVHFDQRWLDAVPAQFPSATVLREPGINVGWWRLVGRTMRVADGHVFVDADRCSLLHMSGFRPLTPTVPCLYYPELLSFEDLGPDGRMVFDAYAHACMDAGFAETHAAVGCWVTFDDGALIPDAARTMFRDLGKERQAFGDPFSSSEPGSFRRWLDETVDAGWPEVTRFWLGTHALRPDLRAAFPDPLGRDRGRFVAWTQERGSSELVRPYPIDDSLGSPG